MNLKTLFLGVAGILCVGTINAQDKIYKRNGDVIDGKVKAVDGRNVTIKRSDNPKGPDYIINKSELEKVEYENGSEDLFSDRKRSFRDDDDEMEGREVRGRQRDDRGRGREKARKPKIQYGNNLITLAPVQITENGFGLGLAYEHTFGKKGIVALSLPLIVTFGDMNDPVGFGGTSGMGFQSYTNVAFMPGIKIYAGGSKGKVRYGIGPSFVLVSGQKPVNYYTADQYGYITQVSGLKDNLEVGAMLTNSLNMSPSKHMYIGIELGLGMAFVNEVNGVDQGHPNQIAQFAFKIGYRF